MKSFASAIITGHRGNYNALPIGLCKPITGDPRAVTVDIDWFTYAVDLGVRGRANVRNVAAVDRTLRQTAVSTGTAVVILPIGAIVEFTSSAQTGGYLSVIYSPSAGTVLTGFVLASALNIEREPRSAFFNAGVSIDLGAGVGRQMGDIVGVYIDNADVATPVYLRCDDTGQIITCSDYKSGYFALLSNEQRFTIFADDIVPPYTAKSVTRIVFTNAPLPNFAEEQFNEVLPLNRVSGLAQYRSQALGDKSILTRFTGSTLVAADTVNATAFNAVVRPGRPNSMVAITSIVFSVGTLYADRRQGTSTVVFDGALVTIEHNGLAIADCYARSLSNEDGVRHVISGINLMLDGARPINLLVQTAGNSGPESSNTPRITYQGSAQIFMADIDVPLLT